MKKILILCTILLLTGCQAKYELNYEDDRLTENIKVITKKDKAIINELKSKEPYAVFEDNMQTKYKRKFRKKINSFEANYYYTFTPTQYNHHNYGINCFEAINFIKDNNKHILTTTEGFKCRTFNDEKLENVQVEISTNHEVLNHNADEVKNGKYIWNINKSNSLKKQIYVEFGEIKNLTLLEKIIMFMRKHMIEIIVISAIIIILFTFIIYNFIKYKRNNDI